MDETGIYWPDNFAPQNSHVHIVNCLEMDVTPQAAWAHLIDAVKWPNWYSNSKNVRISGGDENAVLSLGAEFHWTTFGMNITCTVEEFQPFERLAWSSISRGMQVYHAWLILPRPNGCYVITEETQNGFISRIAARLMPGRMHKFHQIWLEGLNEIAR